MRCDIQGQVTIGGERNFRMEEGEEEGRQWAPYLEGDAEGGYGVLQQLVEMN